MNVIADAETTNDIKAARELFREYEFAMDLDLCFQGFEEELADLPGKYAAPDGRLLLAYCDGRLAGCAALRKLGDGVCEMKRLYVRDEFRGRGVGLSLIQRVIADARSIGYAKLRLDTAPDKMGKAVEIYRSHGFAEIPPYYHNPNDGVLYMELNLR